MTAIIQQILLLQLTATNVVAYFTDDFNFWLVERYGEDVQKVLNR